MEVGGFINFIELSVIPDTAKPGQMIDINVMANPNSYVGVLGIDKRLLALGGANDLNYEKIRNALEEFDAKVKSTWYDNENTENLSSNYNITWDDFAVSCLKRRFDICKFHFF